MDERGRGRNATVAEDLVFSAIIVGTPWLAGRAYAGRQRRAREMEERSEWLERAREADMRAAVAEERARIGRELHVGQRLLRDPVGRELDSRRQPRAGRIRIKLDLEARASELLHQLLELPKPRLRRQLRCLAALAQHVEQPAQLEHRFAGTSLDRAERLTGARGVGVEHLRRGAGLHPHDAYGVGDQVVIKHAHARSVVVAIRRNACWLELEVIDDGVGAGGEPTVGHGLIGMRERVALYGGSLQAGSHPKGGWRVLARLGDAGQSA